MTPGELKKVCEQVAPLLVFFACDEVDNSERTLIEQHLAECDVCRAQFAEESKFHAALASIPQDSDQLDASSVLLSQCRSELAENLDDMIRPAVLEKAPVFGAFRRWMALRPVWSGGVLVLLGLLGGVQSSQWLSARQSGNPLDDAVSVRPATHLSDDQLSKIAVAGINFTPSAAGTQNVRVQLSAEQQVELSGSLDDSDVRRVLTYVVKNGERFDPGVRLDCLDALKVRAKDAEVQEALLSAARKDQNPAVRLKALEALRDSSSKEAVRAALLEALRHDSNPGVRVEAVNLLVASLEKSDAPEVALVAIPGNMPRLDNNMVPTAAGGGDSDPSLVGVIRELESLQRNDPSRYVRLRSAAALRQISARNDQ